MGYAYGGTGIGHVLVIKGYVTVGGTNYLVDYSCVSMCCLQQQGPYEQGGRILLVRSSASLAHLKVFEKK